MFRPMSLAKTNPSALDVATCSTVVTRSAKIALVVGFLLMGINHGDTILQGEMSGMSWLKCALTFLVPYCVSTVTAVMAARDASG